MFIVNFILQKLINRYYKKVCDDKFFIYEGDEIIGKVKYILPELESFANDTEKHKYLDEENMNLILHETNKLIKHIKKNLNKNDVIYIASIDYFHLVKKWYLYKYLKAHYKEWKSNPENYRV